MYQNYTKMSKKYSSGSQGLSLIPTPNKFSQSNTDSQSTQQINNKILKLQKKKFVIRQTPLSLSKNQDLDQPRMQLNKEILISDVEKPLFPKQPFSQTWSMMSTPCLYERRSQATPSINSEEKLASTYRILKPTRRSIKVNIEQKKN